MTTWHCIEGRRWRGAAVRGAGVALASLALGFSGCASFSAGGGGEAAEYRSYDSEAARCERDRGVWRPQIANGYCEYR